ncbi:DUF4422 domain-containing protein [Capnocytophaga sputigena]|jgi:exopolysaccharide biosynthesis protein|uniref:DUF4422 domain-containing protein n=1 Tax=Capnocytophaga sputigena TaxID=1019 RepID=UPI0028EA4A16|nr:DUF4422 domain-containing protein [Capnocytophaga sputigena]
MSEDKNIKILVCCHKKDVMATQSPYLPIQVGKAISNINLGIQTDNTGDNISEKNQSYCELTGIYWAWKNLKDIDYIGLCHYRRYFDFHKQGNIMAHSTIIPFKDFDKLDLSVPKSVLKELEKGYIFVPKKIIYKHSLYIDYCINHISEDIRKLEDIINIHCEDKYKKAFKNTVYNNKFYACNMFLMSWKEFDKYCQWLFYVLAIAEQEINITNYSSFQKRIFGYMGERLFNIYISANNLKIKELSILRISNEENSTSLIKRIIRSQINNITSLLHKI